MPPLNKSDFSWLDVDVSKLNDAELIEWLNDRACNPVIIDSIEVDGMHLDFINPDLVQ